MNIFIGIFCIFCYAREAAWVVWLTWECMKKISELLSKKKYFHVSVSQRVRWIRHLSLGVINKCGSTHMHTYNFQNEINSNFYTLHHTCSLFGENLDEINCWCTQKSHSLKCIALNRELHERPTNGFMSNNGK